MGPPRTRHRPTDGGASTLASLLWPPGYSPDSRRGLEVGPDAAADLDVGPVVQALSGYEPHREPFVSQLLRGLCIDSEVIVYRAEVLTNLLEEPELRQRLTCF